jgi:uncharacterized membrane protein YheB (UPF0754 family)
MDKAKHLILDFQRNRDYAYFSALGCENAKILKEIILLCYEKSFPFPEYSSWLISHITERFPEQIKQFHTQLIDAYLENKNESLRRNLLNSLLRLPLHSHRDGAFLDQLFHVLIDFETKVAHKVYAMYFIVRFCEIYPELADELKQILSREEQNYTPAYYAGKRKVLKALEKLKSQN